MSNGMVLDQDRHSVRPDLGSNWLQRLPAPLKILTRMCGCTGWSKSTMDAHAYLLLDTSSCIILYMLENFS